MVKEYIGEGNTLLEATASAKEGLINTLGLKNDDEIKIEVVSDFKKKTLGLFGGSMAKVKAFIELPDKEPEKKVPKKAEKTADKKADKKAEKPAKKESADKKAEKKTEPECAVSAEMLTPAEKLDPASGMGKAAAYIKTVMEGLGCENVTVSAAQIDGGIYMQLDGEKLGVVIGRRGETLDALQYLTSLVANTGNGYQKVTLNIGNYREKREQTLISLAKRVSAQVISNGRSRSLEPMNPYERRIIHTAVQEIEGVESNSIGEGSSRRVVISPVGGDSRPMRRENGRGRRNDRERRPSQTVASTPTREPKKDSGDIPLYGRIK